MNEQSNDADRNPQTVARKETRKRGHAINLKHGEIVIVTLRGNPTTEVRGKLAGYQDGLLLIEDATIGKWVLIDRTTILHIRAAE